jgi:hypothetical protein
VRSRRVRWLRSFPLVAVLALAALPAGALAATGLPSQCVQAGSTDTCTFTTAGETSFTVPQNLTSMSATVAGGHGGTSLSGTPGGLGAVASGTVSVTPGDVLFLEVNALGGTAGRDNGIVDGGKGGGESDVRTCSASAACSSGTTLSSRLLIAGGGGGGGSDDGQGHGGNAGTTGNAADGTAGTNGFANAGAGLGATTVAPGTGGASCGDGGSNGAGGATGGGGGGAGGNSNSTPGNSGGGGGAGWFGGGGGGGCARAVDFGGSGGGGTSHADASVASPSFSQATASQAASVILVFTAPFAVTTPSVSNGTVGVAYNQTLASANGTAPVDWSLSSGSLPDGVGIASDGTLSGTPTKSGTFTFTAQAKDSSAPREVATGDFSITIAGVPTTTSVSASPSSPLFGQAVTFTATVTAGGNPVTTGSVQWLVDGTDSGSPVAVAADGTAQLGPVPGLSVASHAVEADYLGSSQDAPSSKQSTVVVGKATPGLNLSASPSVNATVATPVTLTATLTSPGGVASPTGSVSFTVDGSPTSCGSVTVTTSQAQCSLGDLASGPHNFAASYNGDGNYLPAGGTLTGYDVATLATTTSVSASPSSPSFGQAVTFTATTTVGASPVTTGSVQWLVDGTDSGSPVAVAADGTAQLGPVSGLSVASHTIEADYLGSSQDAPSSKQSTVVVAKATPGLNLSASPSVNATVATPVTLTAALTSPGGVASPTGSVSFTVDGSPASCGSVTVTMSQAQCSLGDLASGPHDFAASYNGDGNYQPATATLTGYPVALQQSVATLTPTVAAPVFGQPVAFTAGVTSGGSPVVGGSVQWLIDGAHSGSPVAVAADGTAQLGPVSTLSVGTHAIEADYLGSAQNSPATQQLTIVVDKAQTTTAVHVASAELSATVAPVAPGAGTPSGTVTFAVNGTTVGTAPLAAAATAVLPYASTGAETVSASYGGDASFAGSSASTATGNPAITATLSSAHPKTKYGWYRSAVTVTFACTPGPAPLAGPCPDPVTLSTSGGAQSVARTISDVDGGVATAVSSPINIDRSAPRITVTGARRGATYNAPGPRLRCHATDALSGLARPCRVAIHRSDTTLAWTATATDRAGNTAKSVGRAHLVDFFVAGARRTGGSFTVKVGSAYTVEAFISTATEAPTYVFAVPSGSPTHRAGQSMIKIGRHRWATRVRITPAMGRRFTHWTLRVLSGRTLHTIPITLER